METDTVVLDASNTRSVFLQGQKLPEYDHTLALDLGHELGFHNPARKHFVLYVFVPKNGAGVATQGKAWQREKGTSNSAPPSETPNKPLRPFRGLASGICYQMYSTNSRGNKTPFQQGQVTEISHVEMRENHHTAPEVHRSTPTGSL